MDKAVEPEVRRRSTPRWRSSSTTHPLRPPRHAACRQRRFVDVHMHMPAGWTLGRAALRSVEQALMSAVPGLRASIQLLPTDVEAHFDDRRTWCDRAPCVASARRGRRPVIGAIRPGLLMLVCAEPADSDAIADKLVAKVLKLRIFADEAGKMNRSVPTSAAACWWSASSRSRPMSPAATARASPAQRARARPPALRARAGRRARCIRRSSAASSAPTCRCTSSTTAR
jgi:hypothetical protein